jgi:hypothetical protein
MEAALLLAKLPEAYQIFDPLVDVLPVITALRGVFGCACDAMYKRQQLQMTKIIFFINTN